MQRSPAEPKPALIAWSAARSRSASGSTSMWFFAPPRAWTRLPCDGAGLVDVLGDRGRADEGDRLHLGVGEQTVDGDLVAVQHVEDTVGQTGLLPQLRHPQRRRRHLLARLQHHGVAGRDGDREEPHRHHGREVERGDDPDHAERLAYRVHVDLGRGVLGEAALHQVRDAAGELDDLLAAAHLAQRVGEHLAVLGGDDRRQLLLARRSAARGTRTGSASAWPARCPATPGTPPPPRPRPRRRRPREASASWAVTSPVAGLVTSEKRPLGALEGRAVRPVMQCRCHEAPSARVSGLRRAAPDADRLSG